MKVPKDDTVELKFKEPSSVNSIFPPSALISPSTSKVPVDIVTLPLDEIVVVPLTSRVLEFTSKIVEDAVTIKLPPTLVVPCKVFVAPPEIVKL